jgi:uncharacterized Zn finger protein (UPF0148 family)
MTTRNNECPFCGSAVLFDPGLGMNICMICGARETAKGWQARNPKPDYDPQKSENAEAIRSFSADAQQERRAEGIMTIEERLEKLNTITNAGTAVVGFLDLILHPESEEQKIDKDECLRKAFQNAERVLKAGHELRWDVIAERSTPPR